MNDEEQRLNAILEKEIAVLDSKIKTISDLNSEKKAMINRLDTIERMQSKRPLVVKQINGIQTIIPEDVYYTSLTYSGGRFLIEASATNDLYISEMMRHIDQSDVFSTPILRNVTDQSGERAFNMSFMTKKGESVK
jgi:type IV pilus assembly protein PilN